MIDIKRVFETFLLPREGVVHVGSHFGNEISVYEELGLTSALFIEAQPATFSTLCERMKGREGVFAECIAISDRDGNATFNVTNNGQSSSILELKKHKQLHPDVEQIDRITVETTTLDSLIERKYPRHNFAFLNIDIQGAELLAFKGATRFLERVSAINCEVNFDELYVGAPHVSVLDAYLSAFSFTRVETFSATKSWGDAVYVKNQFTKV